VAANVRALRQARGLDLADLADRMNRLGQSLSLGGLSKLERGDRRVDVDDLMALAIALDVTPSRLLLPADATEEPAELTPELAVSSEEAWSWACGEARLPASADVTLNLDALDRFFEENRPHDPPDRTTIQEVREKEAQGHLSTLRDGYRQALEAGLSPAAVREYLSLIGVFHELQDPARRKASRG
jgi:transcriptional regulator with XRE-family HTH domain